MPNSEVHRKVNEGKNGKLDRYQQIPTDTNRYTNRYTRYTGIPTDTTVWLVSDGSWNPRVEGCSGRSWNLRRITEN